LKLTHNWDLSLVGVAVWLDCYLAEVILWGLCEVMEKLRDERDFIGFNVRQKT
jgi:hypothetical protein